MVRRNQVAFVCMIALLALAAAGCSTAAPPATEVEPAATVEPAPGTEPGVVVENQDAGSGVVTVKQVDSAGPGWMVIHATTDDGGPGAILGYTPVVAGSNHNVTVEIDLAGATDQVFAMLHVDAGVTGTFEFPNGDDVPARSGEQIVNVPFQVSLPAVAVSHTTLALGESSLGKVLVDGRGFSLYLFSPDGQGESTCYDSCAENWPPFTIDGEATVGDGLDEGLLGTTVREGGSIQLTYAGWPLYYFFNDVQPGDVNGQGVNDVWYLLKADGSALIGGDGLPDY